MNNKELFDVEAQKVMDWMWKEREKLREKFKDSTGLDINATHYNNLDKETLSKLDELKVKYGLK